ncbi:MAG TPA: hypothetical protein VLS51_00165, partial [Propionibacteriaceae bacterium]|nr:hypothetical protein [Propionibacteriaceae bacterium]
MSTTAATKASTTKRLVMSDAALHSLGLKTVTESAMVDAYTASQAARAVAAFLAYAFSMGWAGKPRTGSDIAKILGTTAGNVSALLRAGAILNRAGAHAAEIGPETVTLCQNTNASETAALDSLTGVKLVAAVKRMRRDALDRKAQAQGRKAQPEGKGNGSPKTDDGASIKADEVTDKGRASVALQMLRAIKT